MGENTGQSSQLACWVVVHPMDMHSHTCLGCIQTHTLPDVGLGRKAREVDWIGCVCVHTSQAAATQALLCYRKVEACMPLFLHTGQQWDNQLIEFFLEASR